MKYHKNRLSQPKSSNKLTFLFVGVVFVQVVFILRLFQLQVLQHAKYTALANDQHWELQDIPAVRGTILSRNGYPLASNQPSYLMYGNPKLIEDPLYTADELAKVVAKLKSKSDSEFLELHTHYKNKYYDYLQSEHFWVALERNLSIIEKTKIEEENLAGIGFEKGASRHYPEGTLAAHVLGFVASDEFGERQGYYGIEGRFNGELKGKPGRIIEERDATGTPILVGDFKKVDPIKGRDVVLTIDRAVQYVVEKRLKEGVEKYGALAGSVIVMNPLNGDVLAMANYPTYDPLNFNDFLDTEESDGYTIERKNLSVSETYEPGSVIKALTVSAGIDSGKITPYSTFEDLGPVTYSGYTIDNWDLKHHGTQNMFDLLKKSNNIGSAWVGHVLGADLLSKYFDSFGLGTKTGIELEGEDTGIIRDSGEWTDIDLATAAFGQGISATPLQVLNAFNALANSGRLMQPRIVLQVVEEDETIDIASKELGYPISEETAETMVSMLTEAVADGESKYFNLEDYKIAGKTGTAQIPVDGKYDPSKTNVTFVGFLPTSRRFSMLVHLNQPSSSIYAAETAVPLWMQITDDLVKYYGVPPDDI
ncbi:MAG: peptidoglycan D,D-transpeptidase FtsI family protein [Patescibacteria group bacterium]